MNKIYFFNAKAISFSIMVVFCLSIFSVGGFANGLPVRKVQNGNAERRLERIADRIERAFEADAELRRYDLDADEENGRYIELEGTVRTRAERNRALTIARQTAPRNVRIVNNIRVRR